MLNVLQVRQGGIAFNDRVVLSGLDIRWEAGSLHLLYGAMGSGKTTLLRALAGWARYVSAMRIWGDWEGNGERLGASGWPALIHQRPGSLGARVSDELGSALADRARLPVAEQQSRIVAVLSRYQLECVVERWNEPVFRLPPGERQQVALARVLLLDPPAVLGDELHAGADAAQRERMLGALTIAARERVVVLATHDARDTGASKRLAWTLGRAPSYLHGTAHDICGPTASSPIGLRFRAPNQLIWVLPRRLAGMPRPGLLDPLAETVESLAKQDVTHLLNLEEAVSYPANAFRARGIEVWHTPIADMGVPRDIPAFSGVIDRLSRALSSGERVVVHCKAGLGRTGLALALLRARQDGCSAIEALVANRTIEPRFVQSEAQWKFLSEWPRR